MKTVAILTYSQQFTQDSWQIVTETLICKDTTPIAEIIAWATGISKTWVRLEIAKAQEAK